MYTTVFARSWAIDDARENNVRTYWRVASGVIGLVAAALLVMMALGRGTPFPMTHVIAALALAGVGAYVGYKKDVPPRFGVTMARAIGIVGLAIVAAAMLSYVVLGVFELALLASLGAVALYVGFSPN